MQIKISKCRRNTLLNAHEIQWLCLQQKFIVLSEWIAAIKLNSNYANLNGVPGVDNTSILCRRCLKEKETISRVIGSCRWNNLLINSRHHGVKNQVTELLQSKGFQCFEEVYALDTEGRSRFNNIIAFKPKSKKAYIIDPTIRYESNRTKGSGRKNQKHTKNAWMNGWSEGHGLEVVEQLVRVCWIFSMKLASTYRQSTKYVKKL